MGRAPGGVLHVSAGGSEGERVGGERGAYGRKWLSWLEEEGERERERKSEKTGEGAPCASATCGVEEGRAENLLGA